MKTGENKFLDIGMMNPAFYCSRGYLKALFNQSKSEENIKSKHFQEFIEEAEIFFERYKNFHDNYYYMKINIIYNNLKSRSYRLEGKLELAEIWSKKSYELAESAYKKFENESFQKDYIYNKQRYWEFKAKRLEKEHKFIEAAEYYKKAAWIVSSINPLESFDQYVKYYKCLAMEYKRNYDTFKENIDNAIEYATKRNDEIQIHYLKGFKYENLMTFTRNVEEKIDLLEKSKEHFFKAGETYYGKYSEYLLFYYRSKKALMEGKYKKSIGLMEKAVSYSKLVYFPNIVSSRSILKNELSLHQFYLFISNGDFNKGNDVLKNWLECRKDITGTNKHVFYSNLSICCQKLSKFTYSSQDLHEIEDLIQLIKEKRFGLTLYVIAALTYSYLSLKVNKIDSDNIFENIKLEIISKITTDEAANYVKKSLEVQNALEKREWLYRLPPVFAEKFDDCVFLLNDVTEGYHHIVFKEFYKLLENFLKIIVEFNGKTLWQENFEVTLKEKMNLKKDFNSFTLGEFYQALIILKDCGAEFCSELPSTLLELVEYHVEKRNKFTHEFKFDDSIDILQDTTQIILGLLKSFPTIIKVTGSKRSPWYDIEIQWNSFPRKISLYSDKDLKENGIYYLEPMLELIDSRMSTQFIIPK